IWSDQNKFDLWLKVEIAVCEAWADLGRIPQEDMEKIRKATVSLDRVAAILQITHHDVTAFLQAVAENLGPESRFIHFGLTSSDVMDTALGLQMKSAAALLQESVDNLVAILRASAIKYKHTIMMGRTHGVHAEPMTFGLKLALWAIEMERNSERLRRATDTIAVGKISGAVGTHATVPLEVEEGACRRLGLSVAKFSNQIVQRDRHAEFLATLAITASSLEKFATEIRGLQRTEVQELEEPFEKGQTGSSAMPHKRNPELCERVCGLARLLRGNAVTAMENISLWHERDISHSSAERIILPDSCLVLDYVLAIFTSVISGLRVNADRMRANLDITHGLIFSQRSLMTLIDKGMSRQDAYKLIQKNAMHAWEEGKDFRKLLEADPAVQQLVTNKEFDNVFDYSYYLHEIDHIFERAGLTESNEATTRTTERLAPRSY
ncbi:MAG: adenylosuccinate lyase, partial [Dehalococcoidia bacterium]|nr:adenylosuccinate lyase [Dehalococcoidia bacterium]